MRHPWLAVAAVVAVVTVAGGLTRWALTSSGDHGVATETAVVVVHGPRTGFAGTLLVPPPPLPSLRLTDTDGRSFDLRARPAGDATALFFGYTHCQDVCPTTMADLAAAGRALPAELRQRVDVVFVTEDPARDTPTVLRRWLDRFDPAIIGLIGGNGSTREVLAQLHLPQSLRAKVAPSPPRPARDYEVEHSGAVYVFGPRGQTLLYTGGTTPAQYAADFTRLFRR